MGAASVYLKTAVFDTSATPASTVWKVDCNSASDSVIGGGYWIDSPYLANVFESAPSGNRHSWYVSVEPGLNALETRVATLHVYAYCTPEKLAG